VAAAVALSPPPPPPPSSFPESFACLSEAQEEVSEFEEAMEELSRALGLLFFFSSSSPSFGSVQQRRQHQQLQLLRAARRRVAVHAGELRRRLREFRWTVLRQFGAVLWSRKAQLALMLCSSSLALAAGLGHAAKDQTRAGLLETLSSLVVTVAAPPLLPASASSSPSSSAAAAAAAAAVRGALDGARARVLAGVKRLVAMEGMSVVLDVVREKADECVRAASTITHRYKPQQQQQQQQQQKQQQQRQQQQQQQQQQKPQQQPPSIDCGFAITFRLDDMLLFVFVLVCCFALSRLLLLVFSPFMF
jgi:hypothetical protein